MVCLVVLIPMISVGQDFFNRIDKNGDGKITRDELSEQNRHMIDRIDKDGDGAISREEDKAFREQRSRQGNEKGSQQRGPRQAPQTRAPEGYKLLANLNYAGNENPKQTLDLVVPDKIADKPFPLIVFIHGGGFKAGDKAGGLNRIKSFLDGSIAGASINYRLSNEAKWPAQINDCKAAIRWFRAHAKEYNIDPARIAVHGTSAGGHLVAMLGVAGSIKDLEGDIGGNLDQDSAVTCVIDFFGPSEMLTMGSGESGGMDHESADSPEGLLLGGPVKDKREAAIAASPITYVSAKSAAILIAHGNADKTVPYQQSVVFDRKLKAAGVKSFFITMDGGGHGFPTAGELEQRMKLFLDKYLLGKDAEDPSEDPIKVEPRKR